METPVTDRILKLQIKLGSFIIVGYGRIAIAIGARLLESHAESFWHQAAGGPSFHLFVKGRDSEPRSSVGLATMADAANLDGI
jgi:hypothetical protein